MICPNCGKKLDSVTLIETADDYHDGYIECGEIIATFNLIIIDKEL